jgi:hypothetical protein
MDKMTTVTYNMEPDPMYLFRILNPKLLTIPEMYDHPSVVPRLIRGLFSSKCRLFVTHIPILPSSPETGESASFLDESALSLSTSNPTTPFGPMFSFQVLLNSILRLCRQYLPASPAEIVLESTLCRHVLVSILSSDITVLKTEGMHLTRSGRMATRQAQTIAE